MESKLIEYGFAVDQVKQLMTKGKLNTGHGIYILNGEVLELKQDNIVRVIEL